MPSRDQIDSLQQVLKTAREDTSKINSLNALSELLWQTDCNAEAKIYAGEALLLSKKISFKKGKAMALRNMGIIEFRTSNYPEALKNHLAALKLNEEIRNKNGMSSNHNGIALCYLKQGNYSEALKHYFIALKISEETGDKKALAALYNNIANVYGGQNNYADALKNYLAALKINESTGNKKGITSSCINIGIIYTSEQNYAEALKNFEFAMKTAKEIDDRKLIALASINLADVYKKQGRYTDALNNLLASLKIKEETDDNEDVAQWHISIGKVYSALKNFTEAKKYLERGLAIAEKNGDKEYIRNGYIGLSEMESEMAASSAITPEKRAELLKSSLSHYKIFIQYKDSLLNEANNRQLVEMKAQFESDKKDKEIALLSEKEEVQRLEIKKQRLLKNMFIGGLVLAVILSFFIYRTFRTRQQLKLQTMRNKIASDLHDDVGSTLSSIRIFSELARQQSKEVQPMLDQIGESSRSMLESMADIVWTINPENDNFEKIILRMRSFAYELLGAKKIDFKFEAEEAVNKVELPMEVRKNLYLIFKEATNNIAKYAEAERASFYLKETNHNLSLVIRDNGKGFDMNLPVTGNGLKNMKKRAREMGAQLLIESTPGAGTTIQLLLKLA